MKINARRLLDDINELAKIGKNEEDGGIYRMGFTDADMAARRWFKKRCEEAGLEAHIDEIGNVFGKLDMGQEKTLLTGSHLDSVPCGGHLDGTLGALVGLECLRTIKESGVNLGFNLEVVGTSEEEGRFGGMIGTEAICGELTKERVYESKDADGVSLSEALEAAGLDPSKALNAARDLSQYAGFLEIHIEQGPVLERQNLDIGVVEGISGVFVWKVGLKGEYNHSGTTPMDMRSDAFLSACRFGAEVPRICRDFGTKDARGTIGKCDIIPPNPHTIPGHVEFTLVGRDFTDEGMRELEAKLKETLLKICEEEGVDASCEELSRIAPTKCDPKFTNVMEEATKELECSYIRMPSGAGHDIQFFGKHMPSGMIFVPSTGGVSHSPLEKTSDEHLEKGANVILRGILKLSSS